MDFFAEYMVERKKRTADYISMAVTILTALAATMLLLLFALQYMGIAGIFLLAIIAAWWIAVRSIKKSGIEFEYILTNNELDIDKIVGKNSRKRLLTIDFQKIDRCASITDDAFKRADGLTVKNYAGDMSAQRVYFVDYSKDAEKIRVIFEPNERILQGIKKANPRLVTLSQDDILAEE